MSTTILQNDGLAAISWQQVVYNQISARKATELEKETDDIQTAYDAKTAAFDTQSEQWAKVKASINNADLAVENGSEGIDQVKDILLQMRILVGNYADSQSPDQMKDQFNEYVDQINRIADTYSKDYNPIGNVVSTDWTPNTISFLTDLAGNETSMKGTYVGADFYIQSDDGTLWVPDPGSSTITQYTVFNTENEPDSTKGDGFASTRNGLKLLSYDATTGAVSLVVDPENKPQTVTGTLKTGGLGLMQTWFYGGLDTEDGRAAAIAAIDHADTMVTASESQITSMSASVKSANLKVNAAMSELKDDRSQAMQQELTDTYAAQIKQQQELQILKTTFSNMASQKSYIAQIFSGVNKGPFYDIST
jgi:hypothetical protein